MAKPQSLKDYKDLIPYMAIVTWEHPDDKAMVERLFEAYGGTQRTAKSRKGEESIPWDTIETYYAIGARTVVIIGKAKSTLEIQKISSFFIFNSSIQVRIYQVLAAADLVKIDPVKALKG